MFPHGRLGMFAYWKTILLDQKIFLSHLGTTIFILQRYSSKNTFNLKDKLIICIAIFID